jgi:hypothetical protein
MYPPEIRFATQDTPLPKLWYETIDSTGIRAGNQLRSKRIVRRTPLKSMAKFDAVTPLINLLNELVDGSSPDAAYVLNSGDEGLLKSLDKLSAKDASAVPVNGGASIAAHVDHLSYGFELMNRWRNGEEPYSTADWTKSWECGTVSEKEWQDLLDRLKDEIDDWRETMKNLPSLTETEENGIVGVVVHLGYHFGAIRQINRAIRGPSGK